MTKSSSSYFNMVEGPSKENGADVSEILRELGELVRMLTPKKISVKDIRYDILQFERETKDWENFSHRRKIEVILNNAEKELQIWQEAEGNAVEEYDTWKQKLIERFSKDPLYIHEYFKIKQGENERIKEYARRVESFGLNLKLAPEIRYAVFYKGIVRYAYDIKRALVNRQSDELSEQLISMLVEIEDIVERRKIHYSKLKEETYAKQSVGKQYIVPPNKRDWMHKEWNTILERALRLKRGEVNEIHEQFRMITSSPHIQVGKNRITPLFDTGAGENYITMDMVKWLGLNPIRIRNPSKRFTCLGQPFWINLECEIVFTYCGERYTEKFGIFPYRKEKMLLIGRNFINKVSNKAKGEAKEERLDNLKLEELQERFFEDRHTGIKSNYECPIDCSEIDRVVQTASTIPHAIEEKVEREIERLINIGYIRESRSTWCNKIRPVEKQNGEIRLTTNLILLNQKVPLDRYSLPKVEEMIYSLRDQIYFSKLDLKDGFFQIPLRESDTHKTAFRVKNRLYEWVRMPMGFKNSPAVFQRYMDRILKEEIGKSCQVYVDDILVFGKTEREHDDAVKRVLRILVESGLKGNKEKCKFKVRTVEFLGHKIEKNKIIPIVDETILCNDYKPPGDVDGLRRFLGLITYYRKFIPGCSTLCEPLNRLLRKDVNFEWKEEQECSFNKLRLYLRSPKILTQPEFNKEFILETDASCTGIGAILSQVSEGEEKPVSYASRALTSAERNYSITEKEMLAALWAMEHFEYYLYGKEFLLRSDHKALEGFNSKGYLESERVQRWMERIQKFAFKVEYRKGEDMEHVDALSRMYSNTINEVKENLGEEEMEKEVLNAHEKLIHRGCKATAYYLNEEKGLKLSEEVVKKILDNCLKCKMYNFGRRHGCRHILSYELGEKVGFDIIGPIEGQYIITGIDYFSRLGFAQVIQTRSTEKVLRFLKDIKEKLNVKMFISDGAKENTSKYISEWIKLEKIAHHITSPHHPESNGRIERFNQSILQSLYKLGKQGLLRSRVKKVVEAYNCSYHDGIGMCPNEMYEQDSWDAVKRSQFEEQVRKYQNRFKLEDCKRLKPGEKVLIKEEIYKYKGQPLYKEKALISKELDYDTYEVLKKNGNIVKRHISQLRAFN